MKEHFEKLKLCVDSSVVNTSASELTPKGEYVAWQKYGVAYKKANDFTPTPNASFYLKGPDAAYILGQLPPKLVAVETPEVWLLQAEAQECEGRVMLPPHVDRVRQCSINIYFKTFGEKTAYYEYSPGGSIVEVAHFTAKDGDVYFLNSNKPHSVELINGKPRELISVSFISTPYETVAKILEPYFFV